MLNVIRTRKGCSWINFTHLFLSDFRGIVMATVVDSNIVTLATKE